MSERSKVHSGPRGTLNTSSRETVSFETAAERLSVTNGYCYLKLAVFEIAVLRW